MNQSLDFESWRQATVNSLSELGTSAAGFLPRLVGAIVLLGVGWLVSKLVEVVVRRLLSKLGLDRTATKTKVADTLGRAGVEAPPSWLFARLLFWGLMLSFVRSAVETLGLTAVTSTIDRLISFIPNVFAAGMIVLFGLLLGKLARNVVSSGAAAANMVWAQRIGAMSGGVVVVVVVVLALEQLEIETALLVTILTVVMAASGLAIGISFALGARPVVTHILAGHFLRQSLPHGSKVEVRGHKGIVERVGPIDTLVRAGERAWTIPNGALMEEAVER